MTNNDVSNIAILLVEPTGPSLLEKALARTDRSVTRIAVDLVDASAPLPDALRAASRLSSTESTALIVSVAPSTPGGTASVDWVSMVHRPLLRAFTALRGLVPELLAHPAGSNVIIAVPAAALLADTGRTADSVLGRCLIGLAEGLRAELLGPDFPVSIVLTDATDDEVTLIQRIDQALADGSLYALPSSISAEDVSQVFDPWIRGLADTPVMLDLPPMGPMGAVYRTELERNAAIGRVDTNTPAGKSTGRPARASGQGPASQHSPALSAGRTAIVTGGASGIGLGIVEAMLDRGMNVAIADVREDHIAKALARLAHHEARVMALRLDVTDRAAWDEATASILDRFGSIDVLCLNAGIGVLGTLLQSTPADWSWLMGVNLIGVTNGIEAVLPILRAQGRGGHVLATSSAGGLMVADDGAIYSSAKYGVVALMDCLRAELAPEGIGATTLCPAGVNTNIHDHETMRPTEFGDSGVRGSDAELAERQTRAKEMLSHGADPALVGLQVLAAVDVDAPVVFTDGGIAPLIRLRRDAILTSIALS